MLGARWKESVLDVCPMLRSSVIFGAISSLAARVCAILRICSPPMEETWSRVTDVAALRNAIPWPPESTHPLENDRDSRLLQELAREAKEGIWDALPICAIAEAHKRKAERLMARGNPDDNASSNNSEVYVEFLKYLVLYPHKNDAEYNKTFRMVYLLGQVIDGRASSDELPKYFGTHTSPHTESMIRRWMFLLGLLAFAFCMTQFLISHA
ncbi:hypothetical protein B0H11DRAFT_2046282 [Mycena galericulata]|nr:hypothetical protein B0H11DRAFT_2046282 [Mycena galericulata]